MKKYIVYTNKVYGLSDWKMVTEEYYVGGELCYSCDGRIYSTTAIECSHGSLRIDYR